MIKQLKVINNNNEYYYLGNDIVVYNNKDNIYLRYIKDLKYFTYN